MSSTSVASQIDAFVGLRPLFRDPDLQVRARHRDGTVEMRFEGHDGSHADLTMMVPPHFAAQRKLVVIDVTAWHAPTRTLVGVDADPDVQMKMIFLLLTMVNFCKEAILEALGPAAHGAEWWTDVPCS